MCHTNFRVFRHVMLKITTGLSSDLLSLHPVFNNAAAADNHFQNSADVPTLVMEGRTCCRTLLSHIFIRYVTQDRRFLVNTEALRHSSTRYFHLRILASVGVRPSVVDLVVLGWLIGPSQVPPPLSLA